MKSPIKSTKVQQGQLFTVWKLEQEGRASPCLVSTGNVHVGLLKFCANLYRSTNDYGTVGGTDFGMNLQ